MFEFINFCFHLMICRTSTSKILIMHITCLLNMLCLMVSLIGCGYHLTQKYGIWIPILQPNNRDLNMCHCKPWRLCQKGKLFAPTMWNSPKTQIPIGVWKGGEQGLSKYLPNYKTPFDSFQLFWPTHSLKRFLIMTNKYAIL
jgi:hypothetical protein